VSSIVNFENVCYAYPRQEKWALQNITLFIEEGEFLAIMGENGAGKTTLCKLFNGVIPHSAGGRLLGAVTVDGENTKETTVPLLALKAGMVLDDPDAQIFTSSVRHEAAFGPENLLLPPDEIEERIKLALSAVGLAGFEHRQPTTLSGGEKQRLAIAAALAMKSKILVLDEPLSRLDPHGAREVMSVLGELRQKFQITVVMATHNSGMASQFADRVCVLKDGQIAACEKTGKFFASDALLNDNGIQPPAAADVFAAFPLENRELPRSEKPPAIVITDFCYSYGQDSARIENVNLTVEDNDFIAVIGNNGCGKTTLLKNIAGLLRPCSGDIFIRGKNAKELTVSGISKEAGFVTQNPETQLFTDSVYSEVAFALKNSRLSKTEIRRRVQDALSAVGLEDPTAFPLALSRAERAKTVLACVIAMGCKIIILDEVDVGQDYPGCLKIMNACRDLHLRGFTIIFVTHNMSLAASYAHRLIMLDRKGIVMDRRIKDSA